MKPESEVSYARPHITLLSLKETTAARLSEQLETLARDEACLNMNLEAVGTFPGSEGAVFIAPVVTSQLLRFHKTLLDCLNGNVVLLKGFYKEDHWTPHCTVALNLPETQVPAAVNLCRKSDVFGPANLVEIALSVLSASTKTICDGMTEMKPTRYWRRIRRPERIRLA